jgi:hypothetical protein
MQLQPNRETKDLILHGIAALVGLAFVAAPWLVGFAGVTAAMWNAVLIGVVIAVLGIAVMLRDIPYHGYGYLALGLWAMAAPWILEFSVLTGALYAHLLAGFITALVGALALWFSGNRPLSAA